MQIEAIQTPPRALPQKASTADQLEQVFLEEMLKYCGPSARSGDFGGGIGEDQFSSFLNQQYAAVLATRLDLGIVQGQV